jgi:hypothetical protein
VGRFIKECLTEDPECFLTSDELVTSYNAWLEASDAPPHDGYVQRDIMERLKTQPGVKPITRVKDGARRRGLIGRKLIDTDHG